MSNVINKINLYIDSKNKHQGDTTNNFKFIIPDSLLRCKSNEYFTLNVTYFNCYNTIYQCNNNSNHYQIIFRRIDGSIYSISDKYLIIGNPSVLEIMEVLNDQLKHLCIVEYLKLQNLFTFSRSKAINDEFHTMYIKPINSSNFLGFPNNVETLISVTPSLYSLNVNSIRAINITIDKNIPLDNSNIDNINIMSNHSDIIFQKSVDVPPYALINYANSDGGDSFQYTISHLNSIHSFRLSVYDQNMNIIEDMPDYLMHIQFNIKRSEQIIPLLKAIIDYLKEIYLIGAHIFEKLFSRS
jgi:hypothetical protein